MSDGKIEIREKDIYIKSIYSSKEFIYDFNEFKYIYEQDQQNICIDPKTKEKLSDIRSFIPKRHMVLPSDEKTKEFFNTHSIFYSYFYDKIHGKTIKRMLTFAITHRKDHVVELLLLCSNHDYKGDNFKLGYHLLHYIYKNDIHHNDVTHQKLLKIKPANVKLIDYYTEWNPPSVPLEFFYNNETFGYLIYGDIQNLITKYNASTIFRSFQYLAYLKEVLQISDEDLKDKGKDEVNIIINTKIINTYSNDINEQKRLISYVESIQYVNLEEIFKLQKDRVQKYLGGKSKKTKKQKNKKTRKAPRKYRKKRRKSYRRHYTE
jgi:hypothetical protein